MNKAQWLTRSEEITFIDFPFIVTHHYISYQVEDIEDDRIDGEEFVDSRTGVPRAIKGW